MRTAVLLLAIFTIGCAAQPPLQVSGSYARHVTPVDIADMQRVISERAYIEHHILKLEVTRPDTVRVETGSRTATGWSCSKFTLLKRHGKWLFGSPVEALVERTVVVE
jgi:hypothetical protein